ncbi:unnamed protein product [Spirodela intermedia]|uniref:Uncharacterized protein n=2 Tax=Spirodela intermedia TaxID=51605 RepID=A0A7I8K699_SPIIN|nr:unnamed protein product [Spirodela intermedia]CAA6657126.1 unnamed protein product [Spirodela intermedia]CAA7393136.1 unnamed protein product [Spirodela intermedia]
MKETRYAQSQLQWCLHNPPHTNLGRKNHGKNVS